jgi:hypothetical protein
LDRLGEAVRSELGRFPEQAEIGRIADAWRAAVGEQIARNAWPARFARDGTLHVNTSSSAWAFELGHLEAEIRKKLGDLAPKKVRFAPGPLPEALTTTGSSFAEARPEPSPDERRRGAELARPIEDEKLRNLVSRAVSAALARARSDHSF